MPLKKSTNLFVKSFIKDNIIAATKEYRKTLKYIEPLNGCNAMNKESKSKVANPKVPFVPLHFANNVSSYLLIMTPARKAKLLI